MRIFLLTLILAAFGIVILAGEAAPAATHNSFELHVTQVPLIKNPPKPEAEKDGHLAPAPAIVIMEDYAIYGCPAPSHMYLRTLPPAKGAKDQAPKDYVSFFQVPDNQVMRPNQEQEFDFVCFEVK